jgi:hypothetical protein
MGACCSKAPDGNEMGLTGRDDISSLIQTENMSTEAMRKTIGPPVPLLQEITFARINDDDDTNETQSDPDSDTEKPTQP